jgi:hypothetical protein
MENSIENGEMQPLYGMAILSASPEAGEPEFRKAFGKARFLVNKLSPSPTLDQGLEITEDFTLDPDYAPPAPTPF